jgi:major membrane immunogen (membrane-anchored lipoprotein)
MMRKAIFESAAGMVLVCVLLSVVLLTGCSKKQGQGGRTSQNETSPRQNQQAEKPATEASRKNLTEAVVENNRPQALKTGTSAQNEKISKPVDMNSSGEPEKKPELDLKQFSTLANADEKVNFMMEFSDSHPEAVLIMVEKALDDKDIDVRSAALELLLVKEQNDPNAVRVIAKALKDSQQLVRQSAVLACDPINDAGVSSVLVQALNDESEDVRTAAFQIADQKDAVIRLDVLKTGIVSSYDDVKNAAIPSLIEISSPAAVDILITGLKDPSPEFREQVKLALSSLVSQDFDTYEQAKSWWDSNRKKFDDELNCLDGSQK